MSRSAIADLSLLLYLIYAFFSDLISQMDHGWGKYLIWTAVLVLMSVSVFREGKLTRPKSLMICCVVVTFFVVMRNQAFAAGDYAAVLRWLYCFLFMILTVDAKGSFEKAVKSAAYIGLVHVAAVYYFWLIPSAYMPMYDVWGYWPSGTAAGQQGYKAALTNHYSHNGIVLVITCFALAALMLSCRYGGKQGRRRLYGILLICAMFALVLTTKRAHVLFGLIAVAVVFELCSFDRTAVQSLRVFLGGAAACAAVFMAARRIPEVQQFLDRFSSVGNDVTLQSRFRFWELACQMFLDRPVAGHGWFAFRYEYQQVLYDTSVRSARYELLDCHNVYLQLLAETGIAGFCVYLFLTGYVLWITWRLLREDRKMQTLPGMRAAVCFSALIQVFWIMYSFTGNCLYDITSAFYFLAASFSLGLFYEIRRKGRGETA